MKKKTGKKCRLQNKTNNSSLYDLTRNIRILKRQRRVHDGELNDIIAKYCRNAHRYGKRVNRKKLIKELSFNSYVKMCYPNEEKRKSCITARVKHQLGKLSKNNEMCLTQHGNEHMKHELLYELSLTDDGDELMRKKLLCQLNTCTSQSWMD